MMNNKNKNAKCVGRSDLRQLLTQMFILEYRLIHLSLENLKNRMFEKISILHVIVVSHGAIHDY